MKIGGVQRFSLIDYPGKICAVVFTQGCNFRCSYCQNPELVEPGLFSLREPVPEEEVFAFLERRRGKLDAVVVTGGEPTLQPDLTDFVRRVKELGFLVKLDTNGSKPVALKKVVEEEQIDYIAMDVKAPLERYREVTNSGVDPAKIKQSIGLIMNSRVDYEFRTTVVKSQLDKRDISEIGRLVRGSKRFVLQRFVPGKVLNPSCCLSSREIYEDAEFEDFQNVVKRFVRECFVR